MKTLNVSLFGALVLAMAAPVAGQNPARTPNRPGDDRQLERAWDDQHYDRYDEDRYDGDRYDDDRVDDGYHDGRRPSDRYQPPASRYRERSAHYRARPGAPRYCRNGRGHARHGFRWCVRNRWSVARPHGTRGWRQVRWRDVRLSRPAYRQGGLLNRRDLRHAVGHRGMDRLRRLRDRLGLRGPLTGHLEHLGRGAVVLRVHARRIPIAELYDWDRDRRVDEVFLARRH